MDRTSSFSSRDEVFEEENKYWSLKIKELESYDGWDKQYILGKGGDTKYKTTAKSVFCALSELIKHACFRPDF